MMMRSFDLELSFLRMSMESEHWSSAWSLTRTIRVRPLNESVRGSHSGILLGNKISSINRRDEDARYPAY